MSLRDEMRLIETTHLKTWAGSKPAESTFPYIVKKQLMDNLRRKGSTPGTSIIAGWSILW
jgi:hypothetical protein